MDLVELRARLRAMAPDPEGMAARTGLTTNTVRQLMAGQMRPSPELAERIAKGARP